MITRKLTKREQAKANKLFACKGTKNAYCEETNTNRQTLYRMLKGNAVEVHNIDQLQTALKKIN